VVHPQSVIHSMVQFTDGSTLAQCSPPDMKLPIALALGWPDRIPGVARPVDWSGANTWTFEPLDDEAFPAVGLVRQAGKLGGTAPAVLNAANEECVDAFHERRIGFNAITDIIEAVLAEHISDQVSGGHVGSQMVSADDLTLDAVLAADRWARKRAAELAAKTQEQ
jgi:1-deoxy-D-xylulose-5-phosphate reductoisomerase